MELRKTTVLSLFSGIALLASPLFAQASYVSTIPLYTATPYASRYTDLSVFAPISVPPVITTTGPALIGGGLVGNTAFVAVPGNTLFSSLYPSSPNALTTAVSTYTNIPGAVSNTAAPGAAALANATPLASTSVVSTVDPKNLVSSYALNSIGDFTYAPGSRVAPAPSRISNSSSLVSRYNAPLVSYASYAPGSLYGGFGGDYYAAPLSGSYASTYGGCSFCASSLVAPGYTTGTRLSSDYNARVINQGITYGGSGVVYEAPTASYSGYTYDNTGSLLNENAPYRDGYNQTWNAISDTPTTYGSSLYLGPADSLNSYEMFESANASSYDALYGGFDNQY